MTHSNVIFVVGAARSGSTIFDLLLGAQTRTVSLGETVKIWDAAIRRGRKCACGEHVLSCPFWAPAVNEAHRNVAPGLSIEQWASQVAEARTRLQGLPKIGPAPEIYVRSYSAILGALQQSHEPGTRFVDSSKRPGDARALRASIDQTVLLWRDPRAVRHSWDRKVVVPDESSPRPMGRHSSNSASFRWSTVHIATALLAPPDIVLDYEELCAAPKQSIAKALSIAESAVVIPDTVPSTHQIGGSRIRFNGGKPLSIRADDEWRGRKTTHREVVANLLTVPGWAALALARDKAEQR